MEKGYVLVGLFGVTVESADELETNARSALDMARRFQDRNLECKALADWGLAWCRWVAFRTAWRDLTKRSP